MIALSVDVEPDFPPYLNTNKGVQGLEKIVELLKTHDSSATFFVCADYIEKNPQVVDLLRGFEVGCHGLRHIDYTTLTEMQIEGEFREALEIYEEHNLNVKGFRAPYARVNKTVLEVASTFFDYDSSL